MKRLIVVRHGYTFEENEEPRRVGCRTDLPLVMRGRSKIQILAKYLKQFEVNRILSSNLKRTLESAEIIKKELSFNDDIIIEDGLIEMDYGLDENQLESVVLSRLGKIAIDQWERHSVLPPGWILDIENTKNMWRRIADTINMNETIITVTSAGIAKFAVPAIASTTINDFSPKINPGCMGILEYDKEWKITHWNYFPS